MSDLVEEILSGAGSPRGEADLYMEPLEDGKFLVSGHARLDDLHEHLGFELEADGIDTIGGLVFNRLGYLPQAGAKIELPRLAVTGRGTRPKTKRGFLLQKTNSPQNHTGPITPPP